MTAKNAEKLQRTQSIVDLDGALCELCTNFELSAVKK
jgi:hypothetical protein